MPLYLMLCVDGNGESEVVAMWVVNSEDKLTMKSMVGFFKKHNDVEKTTCVMADKDWVERDVIEEELPHATLLICLFHTLRTFRREVSEKAMGITQDQRHQALEALEKMTYSVNETEYAKHRDALFGLGLPKVTDYFTRQWDSIRHQWVEGLKNNAKHLMNNTNNRLESINQKIKDVVGTRQDLLQFFKELLTYFNSMSQERDHRAAMFAKIPVALHKDNPLIEYVRHLTPYAYAAVKKQHNLSQGISIPDGSGTAIQMKRTDGIITISTTSCECGFFRAMSLPCRHVFALRSFHGLDLFSRDSCAGRWTRSYYKQHRVMVDPAEGQDVTVDVSSAQTAAKTLSQNEKYRAAFQHAQKLASVCSELPSRQFFPSLKILEQLADAWQEGKHITIQVLSTQPVPQSMPVTPDHRPASAHPPESVDSNTPIETVPLQLDPVSESSKVPLSPELEDHSVRVPVDVHNIFDLSPVKTSTCVGSSGTEPTLEAKPERPLAGIRLPQKMMKRGRPKGADLTAIGLPKKKKVMFESQPRAFVTLSDTEKEKTILKMIVGEKRQEADDRLLTMSDIVVDLSSTLLEDVINIQLVEKFFERRAFLVLCSKLERLKESAVWLCGDCTQDTALHTKAVACDSCLQWHHAKCVHAAGKVPKSRYWFCKKCLSSSFESLH